MKGEQKPPRIFKVLEQHSITWDITIIIVIVIAMVSVASIVINLTLVSRRNEQQFTQKSNEYLSFLKESLELPLWNYDITGVAKLGQMMMSNDIVSSLTITDNNDNQIFTDYKPEEAEHIVKSEKIIYRDVYIGSIKLGLTRRLYNQLQRQIITAGSFTIFAIIISIIGMVILSVRHFIKKPLIEFIEGIDSIARGDYNLDTKPTPYIELKDIMQRFNQMAITIKKREESLVESNRALLLEIDEREKAQRLLLESEHRYRSLNENIPVGVFRSTPEGDFLSFNPTFLQILDITNGPGPKKLKVHDFQNSEDRRHLWDEIARKEHVRGFECQVTGSGGNAIWVSISARGIKDDSGNIKYIDGTVEDITPRKIVEEEKDKLQSQLIQAAKMESVGHLAGGIAHDFNNMLSVVMGNLELATLEMDSFEKVEKRLKNIREAAQRSADLVRQLLGFARKQTISPKVIDINDTIAGMLKMMHRLIGEDIEFTWIPGLKIEKILFDPAQIDQILANLVVNARDAIKGIGKITIETKNFTLDAIHKIESADFIPGKYVMLSVSDSGPGMNKDIQEQIFEPFFTTKKTGEGTGLGLATVYGIVKQNNGFIKVYSEPGIGTTFKMYFPVVEMSENQIEPETELRDIPSGSETLLIVEDDKNILEISQSILEQLGYSVITAQTPEKAIDLAMVYKDRIDLLITDVVMPQMNGRELAKRLEEIIPNLKCIYMSGYTVDMISHHGILAEGVNFLPKPFTMQDLAVKIRKTLDEVNA